MKRRSVLKLGATVVAFGAVGARFAAPASAQQKMVLKATDVHPLGYPTVEAVVRMGKKLEQSTNGRLSIQMFPSMQLGGEKEMIEQAQVGALQIARISVGPVGTIVDELNVFNMPFVFRNSAHMEKVVDGPIGTELLDKVSNNPQTRLIGLCWMNAGSRNVYNSKHAVRSIDDLKGLKIRMMGNPIFVDTMNALGGNGIAMGFDQLYNAMQTGVVDGAENLSPMRKRERERLGSDLVDQGYRLCCQTYAMGDVSVSWDPDQKALDDRWVDRSLPAKADERLKRRWLSEADTAGSERAAETEEADVP